jgi:protein involved in temperature-dependent protein secretion
LRCEPLREKVFAGQTSPLVFGDPQRWVALMIEALRLEAQHAYAEARLLRDEAFAAAPANAGDLNAEPFEWIADADPRLGPILEAVLEGRYYWIPWMHVSALRLSEPEDLRDLVWMPAEFTWSNGGSAVGLIPTRTSARLPPRTTASAWRGERNGESRGRAPTTASASACSPLIGASIRFWRCAGSRCRRRFRRGGGDPPVANG